MTITFYRISDPPEKLEKDITTTIINQTPKSLIVDKPLNLIDPEITVDYDAALMAANYAYISAPFNRFYFVNNPSADVGKTIRALLNVDPLMSFASSLKSCPVTVIRSESEGIGYVEDPSLPIDPRRVWIFERPLRGHDFTGTQGRNYLIGLNATY